MPPPRKSRFGFPTSGTRWDPKYPDAATDRRTIPAGGIGQDEIASDTAAALIGDETAWTRTADLPEDDPAYSHVWGFKFVDLAAPESGFKYIGRRVKSAGNLPVMLFVRFKERVSKSGRHYPMTEYKYTFKDPAEARHIFDLMAATEHPGVVVWDELIRKGVAYEKQR